MASSTATTPSPEIVLSLVGATAALFRPSIDLIVATYDTNAESFNRLNNIRNNNSSTSSAGAPSAQQGAAGRREKRTADLTAFMTQVFGGGGDKAKAAVAVDVNGTTMSGPASQSSSDSYGTFHGGTGGGRATSAAISASATRGSGHTYAALQTEEGAVRNDAEDPAAPGHDGAGRAVIHKQHTSQYRRALSSLLSNLLLSLYFGTAAACLLHRPTSASSCCSITAFPLVCASTACALNVVVNLRDWERLRFGIVQRIFYVSSSLLLLMAALVSVLPSWTTTTAGGGAAAKALSPPSCWVDCVTILALTMYLLLSLWESITCPFPRVEPSSSNNSNSKPVLSRRAIFVMLKPYFWPDATATSAAMNRLRALSTWVCVATAKGCNLLAPIYIGRASTALSRLDYRGCITYSVIYAAITFVGQVCKESQSLVYLKVAQAAFVQLSEVSFHHLHSLSLDWHLRKKLGEVIRSMDRGISACDTLMKFLFLRLVPAVAECLLVVIIFSTYFHHFALSVAVFFFVFVYVILTIVMTLWRKKFRRAVSKSDNDWHDRCTDSLVNFETVKYFTAERYEMERFGDAVKKYQSGSVAVAASLSMLNLLQNMILQSCLATGLILAAMGIKQRMDCCIEAGCDEGNSECCSSLGQGTCPGMEVGDFVAVLTYTLQLFTPLSFLGTIYNAIVMAMVDLSNLSELLAENPDVKDAPDAISLPSTNAVDVDSDIAVEFDNVYFHYPTQANDMGLKGLSFRMKRGTVTAIVGHTGAGKTTVSRLFFRFYDVHSGAVRVNGADVRSMTQKSLRDAVGVVPQATALFNDTIRSNILYGRRDATQDDLDRVAKAAQLDAFIGSLPDGWETIVGDRGLKLSGGEKQRTAIARCLLKDPPFIILDEATSSLDTVTEKSVQEALDSLRNDRTCLVIAHRLGTIRNADNIIVLGDGKVLEEGTHDELLARNGKYAEMWNMQLHYTGEKRSENGLAGAS